MRSGIVGSNTKRPLSVSEFRGFAIADPMAPLVFINSRDAKAAQIFTLAHEIAHLCIGATGISNVEVARHQEAEIERFCNAVAAEVLVPARSLIARWNSSAPIEQNMTALARVYRVSSLVVLRRAADLLDLDLTKIAELFKLEYSRFGSRESSGDEGGGDFYKTLRVRNGSLLTQAIVNSAIEGRMLYRDAARLLGVKVPKLRTVADRLNLR
jgi:Zn-dependent peptidase ImmA (M78 family)